MRAPSCSATGGCCAPLAPVCSAMLGVHVDSGRLPACGVWPVAARAPAAGITCSTLRALAGSPAGSDQLSSGPALAGQLPCACVPHRGESGRGCGMLCRVLIVASATAGVHLGAICATLQPHDSAVPTVGSQPLWPPVPSGALPARRASGGPRGTADAGLLSVPPGPARMGSGVPVTCRSAACLPAMSAMRPRQAHGCFCCMPAAMQAG